MQELFALVLAEKDLSKAGDLFSVKDGDIVNDLSEILFKVQEITSSSDYLTNDNNQSVAEICITRVTSAIRETGTIEQHVKALVSVLESCLVHNLRPVTGSDPPHAKIASDIMSCIFLNYSKKKVMDEALPVAVQFLKQGNHELSRNLSSYLSLVVIDNAPLLARHLPLIIRSIVKGNKSLSRILPQIYPYNRQPVHTQLSELFTCLQTSEPAEKTSLLELCALVAKHQPRVLEPHVNQLTEHLSSTGTSPSVLQTFVDMATVKAEPFIEHLEILKQTADQQPATLPLIAKIYGQVGQINMVHARTCLGYLSRSLSTAEPHVLGALLQEIYTVGQAHPQCLYAVQSETTAFLLHPSLAVRAVSQDIEALCVQEAPVPRSKNVPKKNMASQTEGIVTVITVGGDADEDRNKNADSVDMRQSRTVSTSTRDISTKPRSSASQPGQQLPVTLTLQQHLPTSMNVGHAHSVTLTSPRLQGSRSSTLEGRHTHTSSGSLSHPPITHTPVNAIPYRDAVQQFCEKHLDKIKNYIEALSLKLPLPIKATLEEGPKRHCKLHLICTGQSEQCLYSDHFFTLRTRLPRIWIHLMFLAIQARSEKAVSQQEPSVGHLKVCWDRLKADSGNSFVRLVTSSFPPQRDTEAVTSELHQHRFFDVFEASPGGGGAWMCFMCRHPEKVSGLLQNNGLPSLEGKLKEKKGRWKFLKRWKTRHFTLSGTDITYNKKDRTASLPITKIQSVKTIRKGVRDIPKAFEIFTQDNSYVFKAEDHNHAQKWVQCLQIAVARVKTPTDPVTDFDLQSWSHLGGSVRSPRRDKSRVQSTQLERPKSHSKL